MLWWSVTRQELLVDLVCLRGINEKIFFFWFFLFVLGQISILDEYKSATF